MYFHPGIPDPNNPQSILHVPQHTLNLLYIHRPTKPSRFCWQSSTDQPKRVPRAAYEGEVTGGKKKKTVPQKHLRGGSLTTRVMLRAPLIMAVPTVYSSLTTGTTSLSAVRLKRWQLVPSVSTGESAIQRYLYRPSPAGYSILVLTSRDAGDHARSPEKKQCACGQLSSRALTQLALRLTGLVER